MRVTYLTHNCFLLHWKDRVFLFDYPSPQYRTPEMEALATAAMTDAKCWFFISHSHHDHCTTESIDLAGRCSNAAFVISHDVAEMHAEYAPHALPDCHVMEPNEQIEIHGMTILSLESTDLGVGFLISWQGRTIWHGGDVALWNWPHLDAAASSFSNAHYEESLRTLARQPLYLVFANADPRLINFSGAPELLRRCNPAYFVPMHAFGEPERLQPFYEAAMAMGEPGGRTPATCFCYKAAGDMFELPD